ncbi:nuclear transport factor 2 family protein [Mariniflexile sp. AS56]|uniref:nuclear transport factor 2 family protein n=1 Tax=Mariniflexile sp. AS56 TaxID=3063957 RepID=UPI0026F28E29|nr:nuclear transport factor 2 family protein [Mariniflexile sp. AS56]MDO7173447.1 nuclear transport factor 2 family protein [Mariniflexile sp. AS56]
MKKSIKLFTILFLITAFVSCITKAEKKFAQIRNYVPVDKKLFDEIKAMDKVFFDAYNDCDLEKQASIYSDDIEFFHDKGGLMTSKKELIEGTKQNICDKVTRELIDGTIEVYPIKNYGAVQIGFHKFYNNQEPDAESIPSKFIIMWHNENGHWKISKVISLH